MSALARIVLLFTLCASLVLPAGCGRKNEFVPPPPADVTVIEPVKKKVTRYFQATGTTAAIESVEIRARVQGYLEKINFEPRAKVKNGELLFVIDPKPYQARVKQAQAKLNGRNANLNLAQIEMDKSKDLYEKAAVSEIEFIKRTAERDKAKAGVGEAKADLDVEKLELSYTDLKSPINGRISRNLVDVGNLVGAGERTLLATIVNDDSIYAYFNMSEIALLPVIRKYTREQPNTPTQKRLETDPTPAFIGLADEKGYPHEGRIDYASTSVDPGTGTVQVRAVFDNSTGLILAGMFVRIRVPTQSGEALLVPAISVQADQAGDFLLAVNDKNVVELIRVEIGPIQNRMRVIEKGLTLDKRIIVQGLQRARPGATVKPTKIDTWPPPEKEKPKAHAPDGKKGDKPSGKDDGEKTTADKKSKPEDTPDKKPKTDKTVDEKAESQVPPKEQPKSEPSKK